MHHQSLNPIIDTYIMRACHSVAFFPQRAEPVRYTQPSVRKELPEWAGGFAQLLVTARAPPVHSLRLSRLLRTSLRTPSRAITDHGRFTANKRKHMPPPRFPPSSVLRLMNMRYTRRKQLARIPETCRWQPWRASRCQLELLFDQQTGHVYLAG